MWIDVQCLDGDFAALHVAFAHERVACPRHQKRRRSSLPHPSSHVTQLTSGRQIARAKILENDLPVFVVAWQTQEILAYRAVKTGEIAQGSEDRIQTVGYVAELTREEGGLDDPITGGWRIIDVRLSLSRSLFVWRVDDEVRSLQMARRAA